jgi:leader peptidase (prepilin peptidase) / N-methyltransferase
MGNDGDFPMTALNTTRLNTMSPMVVNWYVFFIGMCIGSFLNVCIYRLPAGKSIIRPASACPACGAAIRWYDNIPLISYIALRGRCRGCKAHISIRYPIIELLCGLFAMACWMHYGYGLPALIYFILIAALLVTTFIDIDHRIIPDVISLPGILLGFLASFLLPQLQWSDSLIGIAAGGGSLLAVAWCYQLITGKDGMGGGDIKLLAMIGAFVGWKGVLFTIMASSLIGTVAGIVVMLRSGKNMKMAVPFGPFLAIGAILYIFWGPQVIGWYFNII